MTREQKIIDLQGKILKASKNGEYIKSIKYQNELRAIQMEVERLSLSSVAKEMSVDDHYEAICKMVRMFVFADMLYGAAIDFKAFLVKYHIVDIPIASLAEDVAKKCRNITREIDNFHDDGLSDQFGELCDECNMMVMNKIYSSEARLKEQIKKQHEKV